jgi:hypothetical protein
MIGDKTEKQILRQEIKSRIPKPLTDADIERHTGLTKIVKYSELDNYKTIEELLPADKSAVIILIEDQFNSGHWVAVMRYGKTIEYFNSYGAKWDTDWRFINRMMRMILQQNTNEMTRLMDTAKKDGWDTIWNKHRFQKISGQIQTCGRHVVLRIEMMKMGYTLSEYYDFIKKREKEMGENADFIVAKFVA